VEPRPKIKIPLSAFDRTLESTGILLILLMWGVTVITYFNSPDIIPIHFNASGKADGYGSRLTLWALPAIATCIYAGISWLNRFPHVFNYMVRITEENAVKQYTNATRMLRFLKTAVVLIFTAIVLTTYFTAQGDIKGPGTWFLPVMIFLVMVPTIIFVVRSWKEK